MSAMSTSEATAVSRPLLRDPLLERELTGRGYSVIPLLDLDEVCALRDFYVGRAEAGDLNPPGAYDDTYAEFTIVNSRTDFRREAFEVINTAVTRRVDEHLIDWRTVIATFVNKPPGTGVVPVHQNVSVVDEHRHRSVSVWIALVDCTLENGTLQLVDHSHLAFRGHRGQWAYQDFVEIADHVCAEHLTPVPVMAGEAIVLDDAVIHYSAPNRSDERRLAIQLVVVPDEAETVYYDKVADHGAEVEIDELAIDPSYFWDFWHGVGRRDRVAFRRRIHQPVPRFEAVEFTRRLDGGRELAATLEV